jgi:hypothetical protein
MIPFADYYAVYSFYADPETAARMDVADLENEKHRRFYEDLNRWLARKGVRPLNMIGERELSENLDRYLIYGEVDRVRRLLGDGPLAVELYKAPQILYSGLALFAVARGGPRSD